ncbi:hypothetical protein PNOK_0961600 [Pyrrhoderma noxium]|uniref:Uncharacterized protein n=1 Tax=Pyrrhoderma noxium TaxID=2282107 RepID=A0A286U669_9AGAM|nr:hypothetical protein PNOK_0961600 [Pyrrhoderma noxium]
MFNLADIFNVMAFLSALPFLIFFAKNLIEEPKHASLPAPAELSRGVASDHRSGGATNDEELPPPYSPGDFGRRFFRTRQPSMDTLINALLRQGERSARHQSRERVPRSGAMPSLPASRSKSSRGQPPNTENESRDWVPCAPPSFDFANSRLILAVVSICVVCE